MRVPVSAAILSLTLTTLGCAEPGSQTAQDSPTAQPEPEAIAVADMVDAEGSDVGSVRLARLEGELTLAISVAGLEAGEHAFHLHTTGQCDAPDFKSAGGHLNPNNNAHGRLNENGKHLGDLPNIEVGEDGIYSGEAQIASQGDDTLQQIFDGDGTAVMIHEGPDDYVSDPAGDAGARVACGVLTQVG